MNIVVLDIQLYYLVIEIALPYALNGDREYSCFPDSERVRPRAVFVFLPGGAAEAHPPRFW